MTTIAETNNFKEVIVSTVILPNNIIETIIFFNNCEVWSTKKVQDVQKQHEISVKYAKKAIYIMETNIHILY